MKFIKILVVVATMFACVNCAKDESVTRNKLSKKQIMFYEAALGESYNEFLERKRTEYIYVLDDKDIDAIVQFNIEQQKIDESQLPWYYAKYAVGTNKVKNAEDGLIYYRLYESSQKVMLDKFAKSFKKLEDKFTLSRYVWDYIEKNNPSYGEYLKENFKITLYYTVTLPMVISDATGAPQEKVDVLYQRYLLEKKTDIDEYLYNLLKK